MKHKLEKPKKPMIFYYLITMGIIMILNAFVFPLLLNPNTEEVAYSKFLEDIENGVVKTVSIQDTTINYELTDVNNKTIYVAGKMDDPGLVDRLLNDNVEFRQQIPTESSPLLVFILSWILPILLFVLLGRWLMSNLEKKGIGGGAMSFGKSNAKVYVPAQSGKSFIDVAGQEEAKEALVEIVDFLHGPEKYKNIGAQLPKGALLVGPPGTGKTLLAKAVAGEANVPFFSISGSEFVEMFVGMGASRVRDLFKQAQEKAPCIVFIDEIDAIGKRRDTNGLSSNDEREQTLNQLLAEMDGFDASKGVVILGATNRPETLDKALLRPGRFDRRIPVELPDVAGREAVLKVHAKDIKMGPDMDYHSIALATSGASGAELANMINEAALRAVKQNRKEVIQEDLEESVETVLAGYQRKNAIVTPKERKIVAYHEVGHALVAAMQKNSAPVHKITIIPRTSGALGYTMQIDEEQKYLMSKDEILDKIAVLTGGRAAEAIVFDQITTGASNDIEQATKLARAMITRYGMSEEFGLVALESVNNPYLSQDTSLVCSNETAARIDVAVVKVINEAYNKAKAILIENRAVLDHLSQFLLQKETISGEEFMKMLQSDKKAENNLNKESTSN